MLTHAGAPRPVDEDRKQPGPEGGAPGETVEPTQDGQPGLLHDLLGDGSLATIRPATRTIDVVVSLDQRDERLAPRRRAAAPAARSVVAVARLRGGRRGVSVRSAVKLIRRAGRSQGLSRVGSVLIVFSCRLRRPGTSAAAACDDLTLGGDDPLAAHGAGNGDLSDLASAAVRAGPGTRGPCPACRPGRRGSGRRRADAPSTVPPSAWPVSPSSRQSCPPAPPAKPLSVPLPALEV